MYMAAGCLPNTVIYAKCIYTKSKRSITDSSSV